MPPERLERIANLLGVVAVSALRQVFEARERGQRGLLSWFLCGHLRLAFWRKYAGFTGRSKGEAQAFGCLRAIPSSSSRSFVVGAGAPVKGSEPLAVLGN